MSNTLKVERGISYGDLKERLLEYFTEDEVSNILIVTRKETIWTDGHIVVIYEKEIAPYEEPIYIIVVPELYDKLFKGE